MSTLLAPRTVPVRPQSAVPVRPQSAAPAADALCPPAASIPTAGGAGMRRWTSAEVAQSIAHEINQPLAAILLQAAAARRWLERDEPDLGRVLAALEQITGAGQRVDDIVRSLQALAERRPVETEPVCIDTVLRQTLAALACPLQQHGIETLVELDLGGVMVQASSVQIGQVAMNLLSNAIEALAGVADRPRLLRVSSRRVGAALVELSVSDNGPGVAPQHAAHIFGARFSTRAPGRGLGLSISAAIAAAHGGHVEHQDGVPHGALFRLVLPAAAGNLAT